MKCCSLKYSQVGLCIIKTLLYVLPFLGLVALVFIIILLIHGNAVSDECCKERLFLELEFWLKALGAIVSTWVLTYTLKKTSDTACVQALAEIRTKLNSDEKKKIHFFLMDDEDEKPAILEGLEKNPNYRSNFDPSKQAEGGANFRIDMSNVELFDYLGTIELGAIMLERGLISLKEFKNQFGYRLVNIVKNPEVRAHLIDPECDYSFLLEAICTLKRQKLLNLD